MKQRSGVFKNEAYGHFHFAGHRTCVHQARTGSRRRRCAAGWLRSRPESRPDLDRSRSRPHARAERDRAAHRRNPSPRRVACPDVGHHRRSRPVACQCDDHGLARYQCEQYPHHHLRHRKGRICCRPPGNRRWQQADPRPTARRQCFCRTGGRPPGPRSCDRVLQRQHGRKRRRVRDGAHSRAVHPAHGTLCAQWRLQQLCSARSRG